MAQKKNVLDAMCQSDEDNTKLGALNEWLRRELDLEAKYKGVLSEAERLLSEGERLMAGERPATGSRPPEDKPAGSAAVAEGTFAGRGKAERARFARRAFFEKERALGKSYMKVGRVYFRGEDGTILGVTFSSEKGDGTFFLNLIRGRFHEAALLCEAGPRSVRVVHLPRSFIDRYAGQMSVDGRGEVKFNIRRDGGKWLLEVPQPVGPLDISGYVSPEELTCCIPEYVA